MTAREWLESTYNPNNSFHVRPHAVCADGYVVSIQGGTSGHYCVPRRLCNQYESVELGFPSSLDPELTAYAESEDTCDTVFGCVPIDVVETVVARHGGIVSGIPGSKRP